MKQSSWDQSPAACRKAGYPPAFFRRCWLPAWGTSKLRALRWFFCQDVGTVKNHGWEKRCVFTPTRHRLPEPWFFWFPAVGFAVVWSSVICGGWWGTARLQWYVAPGRSSSHRFTCRSFLGQWIILLHMWRWRGRGGISDTNGPAGLGSGRRVWRCLSKARTSTTVIVPTCCLKGDKSFGLQRYFLKPSFLRVRCASRRGKSLWLIGHGCMICVCW